MRLLKMVVEGETEAGFCLQVLKPHLEAFGVQLLRPHILDGIAGSFNPTLSEFRKVFRRERDVRMRFSSMIDLYGLPRDFPGYKAAKAIVDPIASTAAIESSLAIEFGDSRLIPYISIHEFEALLLADPGCLPQRTNRDARNVHKLVLECSRRVSPEHINGGPQTHPSALIKDCLPDYQKKLAGSMTAAAIGLDVLREKCGHFGEWLTRLESLDTET